LKNDNGSWGAWQTFQNNLTWTMANGVGGHTVTAELKKDTTVMTSGDAIFLSQASAPQLGNLPDQVAFLYSIPQARLIPANVTLTPADVSTFSPLTWTLTQVGAWFSSTPSSGISPQSFQITPGVFATGAPAIYTGSLTVTVSDPAETLGSPHRIGLTLRVIDTPLYEVYLPQLSR
jgi:hypothetical protein